MPKVSFFCEEIPFTVPSKKLLSEWIRIITENERKKLIAVSYIFCTDEYLYQMNVDYLQHDTYTDIITFDQSEDKDEIEGDIFISIPRVYENAKELNLPFEDELLRVLSHGVLHLCGYEDETDEQEALMREKENSAIELFKTITAFAKKSFAVKFSGEMMAVLEKKS
jgi:rRNA maturation RNase YbeY